MIEVRFSLLSLTLLTIWLAFDQFSNIEESNQRFFRSFKFSRTSAMNDSISTAEAIKMAEVQFKKYLPKMLQINNAYLDSQETFTGDFTGDGIADIAIYFSLAPKEGGNTIVGQGLALYQNTGKTIKVIAGYEPNYLFKMIQIRNGKIQVEKLTYADTDPRCCPSLKTLHTLTIKNKMAY